jgi:hypothetical protein
MEMKQAETRTGNISIASQPVLTMRGKPVNPWLVLFSLVFGFFMSLLDVTIAVPSTHHQRVGEF